MFRTNSSPLAGERGRSMIRVLGKTVGRTRLFLAHALSWRGEQQQYAPIAWSLVAGWIWLLAGLRAEPAWPEIALAALYLSALLAAACAIDARYGIIPDSLVIALAVGGLIQIVVIGPPDRLQRLIEAGSFFLAAWLFRVGYHRLRGYHGLGFGDVKLATAAMLWIGIEAAPLLLIVAVLSAFASLLILRAGGHRLHRLQAISFGPHLAIGIWLSWLVEVLQPGSWPLWN
jgi:leader peptidase (prepilin peptidase)/N-methyltransferase